MILPEDVASIRLRLAWSWGISPMRELSIILNLDGLNCLWKHEYIFPISIISQHWDAAGCCKLSSWGSAYPTNLVPWLLMALEYCCFRTSWFDGENNPQVYASHKRPTLQTELWYFRVMLKHNATYFMEYWAFLCNSMYDCTVNIES